MDVNNLVSLSKELARLYVDSDVLSVDRESVLLSEESFLSNFKAFSQKIRHSEDYNREIYSFVEGVKFFTIMSEEDYQDLATDSQFTIKE